MASHFAKNPLPPSRHSPSFSSSVRGLHSVAGLQAQANIETFRFNGPAIPVVYLKKVTRHFGGNAAGWWRMLVRGIQGQQKYKQWSEMKKLSVFQLFLQWLWITHAWVHPTLLKIQPQHSDCRLPLWSYCWHSWNHESAATSTKVAGEEEGTTSLRKETQLNRQECISRRASW